MRERGLAAGDGASAPGVEVGRGGRDGLAVWINGCEEVEAAAHEEDRHLRREGWVV